MLSNVEQCMAKVILVEWLALQIRKAPFDAPKFGDPAIMLPARRFA
jgi:hypothetical protein